MLNDLANLLQAFAAGPVPSEQRSEVLKLLAGCWNEFAGATETKMQSWKLIRDSGAEDLIWDPPVLSFTVERHGGLVLGSSRAEKQQWDANIATRTASTRSVGYRQVRPAAPRVSSKKIGAIADEVCAAVKEGANSASPLVAHGVIVWESENRVSIKHGTLIPPADYQQTTSGRRRRFRCVLESKMKSMGWNLISVSRTMVFQKGQAGMNSV
jgi:hypothetical protein